MDHAISWFEIPTIDLDRATAFYEDIFQLRLIPLDAPNLKMRMFPITDMGKGVGGALVYSGGFHKPSATEGPLLYLNANPNLQIVLDRIPAAGGRVIVPKTQISPEYGYMGAFIDSEGNRIALHSAPGE